MAPRGGNTKRKANVSSVAGGGGRSTQKKKKNSMVRNKSIFKRAKDRMELIQWLRDSVDDWDKGCYMPMSLSATNPMDVVVTDEEIDNALSAAATADGHQHSAMKACCGILFAQLSTAATRKYFRKQWPRGLKTTSPLHEAAENGNLALVRFFIEELKFNINQMDHGGNTPLYHAAKYPYKLYSNRQGIYDTKVEFVQMVRFLLEEGADPNLVSETGNFDERYYPLYQALKGESENHVYMQQIIRLLLQYGADPNCGLKYDEHSPAGLGRRLLQIDCIIWNGNSNIVDALLQYGAFLPASTPNVLRQDEGTALNRFFPSTHQVRIIEHNADSWTRPSAKMIRSTCRVLVKHAKSNEMVAQFLRVSLLHIADKESCKILLNAGMNPVLAMNYAIAEEKGLICQWLLEVGVDPFKVGDCNAPGVCDNDIICQRTPFQAAARLEDTSILELFLRQWDERFAAVNGGKDDNGDYPIHLLCCDPNVSLQAIQLVAERQPDTLTVMDGEESLFPFHFAAMWDAELDIIYTVLRHCPDAALIRR
jgi:ankyrin repeat protein